MKIKIEITTDSFPLEIYWTLSDNCGNVTAYSEKYEKLGHKYIMQLCLPSDKYSFTIYDSYGDGLGFSGGHTIIVNDIIEYVIGGNVWKYQHTSSFGVATTCIPKSDAPTPMPTSKGSMKKPTKDKGVF
jgi:hypothetical protein